MEGPRQRIDYWNTPTIQRHPYAFALWLFFAAAALLFLRIGMAIGWVILIGSIILMLFQVAEQLVDLSRRQPLLLEWDEHSVWMRSHGNPMWQLPWSEVVEMRDAPTSGRAAKGSILLIDRNGHEFVLPGPLIFDPGDFVAEDVRREYYGEEDPKSVPQTT
jgi:hypothetical protein